MNLIEKFRAHFFLVDVFLLCLLFSHKRLSASDYFMRHFDHVHDLLIFGFSFLLWVLVNCCEEEIKKKTEIFRVNDITFR